MKKEDLIDALNEADETMVEAAGQARRNYQSQKKRKAVWTRTAAGIGALAAVIAGIMIVQKPAPSESEQAIDVTPTPHETDPKKDYSDLPAITLTRNPSVGGGGLAWLMYPDYTKETDYNPWTEEMKLEDLPVYKRPAHSAGEAWGLSEEEIRKQLTDAAELLGLKPDGFEVTYAGDNRTPGIPSEMPVFMTAECEEASVSANGYGDVTFFYNPGYGKQISEFADMDAASLSDVSAEAALTAAQWMKNEYSSLLKGSEGLIDVSRNYSYEGVGHNSYYIYAEGESNEETLLNYAYRRIQFAGQWEDPSEIGMIRIYDSLAAAEKIGNYPLISKEEAFEQLKEGNFIGKLPDEWNAAQITDAQIAYEDFHSLEYQIPYWKLIIDITDQTDDLPGLRTYAVCYVPAVDPSFITWEEKDPAKPEPAETEEPQETADPKEPAETAVPEPESKPEPEQTAQPDPEVPEPSEDPSASYASNYVSISRRKQETSWYCAVACTQMILDHFGISKDQNSLAAELNTYAPGVREDGIRGTYDTDVARVLSEYLFGGQPSSIYDGGYRVQPTSGVFVQSEYDQFVTRMKRNIDDGYPSIVQIWTSYLYSGAGGENHNIVVYGYQETADGVIFYTVDPYFEGTDGGGYSTFDSYTLYQSIYSSYEPSYIW